MTDIIINLEVNNIYKKYLNDMTETQIFFGGSSSGKSVFLAQRCILDVLNNHNYLVIRNVASTIKDSAFNELVKVINDNDLSKYFKIAVSPLLITCINGCQIMFKGLDDAQKLKSIIPKQGVITDVWIEEATETSPDDVIQLWKRLRGKSQFVKRLHMSFNPIMKQHWIYTTYFNKWDDSKIFYKGDKLFILKTTYKDNRFLSPDDIKRLESETNSYYYQVYTLGEWGVLGDLVFTNWHVENISEDVKKKFDNIKMGLDFGFTNSPTAFIKLHYDKKRKIIYIFDEFNEKGLTNPEVAQRLKDHGVRDDDRIICDSAEPKSIQELNNEGILGAEGAVKGKDSVQHQIQWLKQHEIVIDISCQETKNECQLFQWKKDRHTGESLNEPIDKHNHHISAIRYATEEDSSETIHDEIKVTATGAFFKADAVHINDIEVRI